MKESTSLPDAFSTPNVNPDNPWLGPEAFREGDQLFFFGRDNVRDAVSQLVALNKLVVLYGRSGLGKTSLLRAGIFPRVRAAGALPVYIRLRFGAAGDTSEDLRNQVKTAVEHAAERDHIEAPPLDLQAPLWEWFYGADAGFFTERSRRVRPILVFDQFEEAFTHGLKTAPSVDATNRFLEELVDLIRGSIPPSVAKRFEEDPAAALKFNTSRDPCGILLSLRQEFLPQLLRLRPLLPMLLDHRFELSGMTTEEAKLVVTGPGGHLVEPDVPERIVAFVAAARRSVEDQTTDDTTVDPAILSIFLRELNTTRRDRKMTRITAELVAGVKDSIIADFYERAVADLAPEAQKFLEDRLVTESGYRDSVALDEAHTLPEVSPVVDLLIERRLLRIEGSGARARLELTHDVLTEPIVRNRNLRRLRDAEARKRLAEQDARRLAQETQERERKEREFRNTQALLEKERENAALARELVEEKSHALRRQRTLAFVLAMLVITLLWVAWRVSRESKQSADALRASRLLAQAQGLRNLASSSLEHSMLLALEAMKVSDSPEAQLLVNDLMRLLPIGTRLNYNGPVRSVVLSPGEEYAAILSYGNEASLWRMPSGEPVARFQHDANMSAIVFSPDGKVVVTAGVDGQTKLWDLQGKLIGRLPYQVNVNAVAFTRNGLRMATASDDGTIHLWDVSNLQSPRELARATHEEQARFAIPARLVAFSPDGNLLASADDYAVRFWSISRAGQMHGLGTLPQSRSSTALSFLNEPAALAREFRWPEANRILITMNSGSDLSAWSIPPAPTADTQWQQPKKRKLPGGAVLSDDPYAIAPLFPVSPSASSDIAAFITSLSTAPDRPSSIVLFRSGILALGRSKAQLWQMADEAILGQRSLPPRRSGEMALPPDTGLSAAVASERRYIVTGYRSKDGATGGAIVWQFDPAPLFSTVSRDGKRAAGIEHDAVLSANAPFTQTFKHQWPSQDLPERVALSADGSLIAGWNKQMYSIWKAGDAEPLSQKEITPAKPSEAGPASALTIARDSILIPGARLLELRNTTDGQSQWSQISQSRNDREPGSGKAGSQLSGQIAGAALSPDAAHVVAWNTGNVMYVWAPMSPNPNEAKVIPLEGPPVQPAFDQAGVSLAVCADLKVELIELSTAGRRTFSGLDSACRHIVFDRSGRNIAIGTEAGSVTLIAFQTLKPLLEKPLQMRAPVAAAAFSAEGRYLAVESDDGFVRVWDIRNGQELSRFFAGTSSVQSDVAFADDHLVFANGSFFEWQPARVIQEGCKHITRNLSDQERIDYELDKAELTCNIPGTRGSNR